MAAANKCFLCKKMATSRTYWCNYSNYQLQL